MNPAQNSKRSKGNHPALGAMEPLRRELTRLTVGLLERGDFGRAQQVTRLLQETSELEDRIRTVVVGDETGSSTGELASAGSRRVPVESKPVADADGYPRFVRRGDVLVRIGLRRDKSETYEQKLPWKEYEAIRDALLPFAERVKTFEAPEIIDRAKTPAYLVYLLLGLLQGTGYVVSPSRGSYRFSQVSDAAALDAVWTHLPTDQE